MSQKIPWLVLVGAPGAPLALLSLSDACHCSKLRVLQFGCNVLRCLVLVIFPGCASKKLRVELCVHCNRFWSEVWGALLWALLWPLR